MRGVMMRQAARAGALSGALIAATALLVGPAVAQADIGLVVESVSGRDVTLGMTVPQPQDAFPVDAPTSASVSVGDTTAPAQVEVLRHEIGPQQVVVLVTDASGSMAGAPIRAARAAAASYLAALPAEVQTGLVTFADEVSTVAAPQEDRATILQALSEVRPTGDTRLYDAVGTAAALIPTGSEGRLLVLSDGADTSSAASLRDAVLAAESAGVPVDLVLLSPTPAEQAIAERMASQTGGTVTTAASADELVEAFEQAATVFATQLRITTTIPDGTDAAGATATVTVTMGEEALEQSVVLPSVASLAGPSAEPDDVTSMPTAAPEPTSPTLALPPAPAASPWMAAVLGLLVAVAIVLAGVWFVMRQRRRERRARIEQVLAYAKEPVRSVAGFASTAREGGGSTSLGRRLAESGYGRRVQSRLSAAEFDLSPATWIAVEVGVALVMMVLLGMLTRSVLLVLAVPVLVVLGFESYLRSRVRRRQRAFGDELPDFLLLLSSALRAGLSFTQALDSAAREHRGEVGRQIRRVLAETQVGARLDDALLACADRMGNDDLRWAVTALSVQREVGGNLSSILDGAASTIKGRHALAREVRTLSAEGRLSAYVLIALPLGVFGFLLVFRREYVSMLWTDPLGLAMLVVLVVLMVIGWLWMRGIVRIRV